MSLINQMLKDLSKRSRFPVQAEVALSDLKYSAEPNMKTGSKRHLIYLILFSVGLFLFIKPFLHASSPTMVDESKDEKIFSLPLVSIPTEKILLPHLVPTVLTGVTLQVKTNMTQLHFSLSQDSLYRIESDKTLEQISIYLDHAHMISALPLINYTHTAIKNMEVVNLKNGDLKIKIYLNPGTELKHVYLTENTQFPELQIDIASTHPELISDSTHPSSPPKPSLANRFDEKKEFKKFLIKTPESLYGEALNLISNHQNQQALNLLTNLIEKHPNFYPARESLVSLFLQLGYAKQADELLKLSLLQRPDYIPFVQMRARLLADKGKTQQALNLLHSISPPPIQNYPQYHAFIAALYQRQGESELAVKLYENVLRVNSNKAPWWVGLGIALESLGRINEAINAYSKASESDELTPELQSYIASRIQT